MSNIFNGHLNNSILDSKFYPDFYVVENICATHEESVHLFVLHQMLQK